jgi:4-amino-4-deoxy-L-arabinose transferase-like glycosyltransferase
LALAAASALYVIAYLAVALARIHYPFELEWVEGGMVDHVRRILAGMPIYAKPSIDFVAFLYPPLYYVAAAGFAKLLGLGFLPLRLLSLLSSLGIFLLIYRMLRKETGAVLPGVLAVGLFAATYDKVGGWLDLARLDSFYLLLLLAGAYALRYRTSAAGAAIAGLLVGAAFLTKQSALAIAVPMALYILLADPRRALWFTGTAAGVMMGGTLLADWLSGGWYRYYCFYLPSKHPMLEVGVAAFWTQDLLPALPLALLAAAAYAAGRLLSNDARDRLFFPLLAVGMIGSSWLVRSMVGSERNNLLPAFVAVSMLAALGAHRMRERATQAGGGRWRPVALGVEALFVVQLGMLAYNPMKHIPTAADRAAGMSLVARMAAFRGDVFVPHHGYLAILAGKRSFAHALALDDVHVGDDGPARRDLETTLVQAVVGRRFAAILLESDRWHEMEIRGTYDLRGPLFDGPDVFWPVTGARLRPEVLCLPRGG